MTTSGAEIRFNGEVVVVTGAAQGLGRAYATAFAERGAHVIVTDVDGDAMAEAVESIRARGGSVTGLACDVVVDSQATIAKVLADHQRIDVVVNNAGIVHQAPFDQVDRSDFERLLDVHVLGTAAMTIAAWDALRATEGRVVNITSGAVLGLEGSTPYAAAKGAILGFTRALATETPRSGVRVNAVMPMARTRMYEEAGGITGSAEDELLTRHFPAEAVSHVVAYLGWAGTPHNGQVFEVAGSAVSRIVLASGPNVAVRSPEDMGHLGADLFGPALDEIDSLATSVGRKLAFTAQQTEETS